MKKALVVLAALLMVAAVFAGGKKEAVVIKSPADLAGKKIGVQAGTTGESFVQEEYPTAKISSFKSGMDAALDLKNGAIDLVVLDELPAKAIVQSNPDLTIIDFNWEPEEYAIAVKKGRTELVAAINATIAAMKVNGDYEALVNAFMPADGNIKLPASKTLRGADTLRLGTNAAFPPFEYVEGRNIVGFDISMGEFIAEACGTKLEVVNMEFDSLIAALQSDAIDFIAAGMSVNEERKKNVDFSDAYFSSKQVVIIRK